MSVRIYYDRIKYRIRETGKLKEFLTKVIQEEDKVPGDLYFIFTDDEALIKFNKEFLDHDYFTDVIAFNSSEGKILNGEVYVSLDTVKRNAEKYKVKLYEEVARVMIHGLLHLCGYMDENGSTRKVMIKRQEELVRKFMSCEK